MLLAFGTWAVYIIDRLLDARAGLRSGSFHAFASATSSTGVIAAYFLRSPSAAACAAAAIIIAYMPASVRQHNSAFAVAALAYFSSVHALHQPPNHRLRGSLSRALHIKEFLVGVLFTAGCALPTLSRFHGIAGPATKSGHLIAAIALFAALAWLNCRAIEHWESNPAPSRIPVAAIVLGSIASLLANFLIHAQPRTAALLAAGSVSAFLIAALDYFRPRLTPIALRVAADLVLLTPLLLLAR